MPIQEEGGRVGCGIIDFGALDGSHLAQKRKGKGEIFFLMVTINFSEKNYSRRAQDRNQKTHKTGDSNQTKSRESYCPKKMGDSLLKGKLKEKKKKKTASLDNFCM